MNGLALRISLSVLGATWLLLLAAVGLAFIAGGGVMPAPLTSTVLGVALLPLVAAGITFVRAQALVRELGALGAAASARDPEEPPVLSVAPALAFEESVALGAAIAGLRAQLRAASLAENAGPKAFEHAQALRVRFIAAMGHDLRSPLNAMLGFADLVALDQRSPLAAQQQRSLEIIRERARDLLALIDDMVDFAKLEAGEMTLEIATRSVHELLEQAITLAKTRSGARGLRVQLEAEGELGSVRADHRRLVQALVGLMDHAARSDGEPTLMLRARCIEVATKAEAGQAPATERKVRIEVSDPQLEIRPADREHLFEAFRPSFAPTGKRIAGLSLGTAIARALVRAQGGDVWFESRPERGTTFVLTLNAC